MDTRQAVVVICLLNPMSDMPIHSLLQYTRRKCRHNRREICREYFHETNIK